MNLTSLIIKNLRNLTSVKINPGPAFNLFYGANASGKTSLLEAIYYLSLGRSFRTRLNSRIIRHDASSFSLFAQVQQQNATIPIGIERHLNGEGQIRIANENARSIAEITKILPLQLLNPDSRLLLTSGPKLRRQFIDWGVFHVEHSFFTHWQHAQRALKQRNAALRTTTDKSLIQLWDKELAQAAQSLNTMRQGYIDSLRPVFSQIVANLIGKNIDVSITYKAGWDDDLDLENVLKQSLSRDLHLGYTQYGPHRADLLIRANKIPAQDVLSQGQQKLAVYALHLAQGVLLWTQTGKRCIYLLDDLAAELDHEKRHRVALALSEIDAQVFVTSLDKHSLTDLCLNKESKLFHVEHGDIAFCGGGSPSCEIAGSYSSTLLG